MRLKPDQLKKLAGAVRDALLLNKVMTVLTNEAAVLNTITGVLLDDAQKEITIENEAKKTMEKFRPQVESGEIDYQKMFTMLKKQLYKDKKFIV